MDGYLTDGLTVYKHHTASNKLFFIPPKEVRLNSFLDLKWPNYSQVQSHWNNCLMPYLSHVRFRAPLFCSTSTRVFNLTATQSSTPPFCSQTQDQISFSLQPTAQHAGRQTGRGGKGDVCRRLNDTQHKPPALFHVSVLQPPQGFHNN